MKVRVRRGETKKSNNKINDNIYIIVYVYLDESLPAKAGVAPNSPTPGRPGPVSPARAAGLRVCTSLRTVLRTSRGSTRNPPSQFMNRYVGPYFSQKHN